MGQALRRTESKDIASFGDTLRKRIDAGMAVKVLNQAVRGDDVSRLQLDAVRIAIDKCLPSLAAVAVAIHDASPDSIHDLNALLLTSGVDPADVWRTLEGEAEAIESVEKVDSA